MTRVIVRVVGAKSAAARLRAMAARLSNLSPAFDKAGDFFRNQRKAEFAGGGGWVPLSPKTVEWKGNSRILIWRKGLRTSWTVKGGPGNINRTGAFTARFGSRYHNYGQPLAALHHSGTPGGHVPARPVDMLNPAFEQAIVDAIVDHIFGG